MGLDMYLEKKGTENLEVGYWRKANQIHKWFVNNVQNGVDDCEEYEVTEDKLLSLKNICETVLNVKAKASELLPSQQGFFFGTTSYDEYYFKDLEYTIRIIESILNNTDFKSEKIFYSASW